ncbi:kinase-like protein [Aaosphaeria arxii CBS 175.79]|uniref:Kinase-like protein n=1 Tax=Aaosphaeria arxii CBS 175.79 TaxID=1450172 RepID=A0A6A5XAT1_9PLEO|nr:kinase-like protein [Aaosphaeria arxii CBS 175.79]KAF2010088.1 kinase-like protein [Aaosphaeria arxii CBS 175.79]
MDGDIYVTPYFPKGVQYIITTGSDHYIGFVNETTILKYPHFKDGSNALDIETAMFRQLGKHPRIIEFKGEHEDGLLLEYAPNGSLANYIQNTNVTMKEKIRFARETAEGVAHVHRSNVLICDIHVRNMLLDHELHIKLCDFQGRLLGADGEVLLSGGASENAESFMPREDRKVADVRTDIFALGSTIYHIITGHRPYPQYHTINDEAKFRELYQKGQFPALDVSLGGDIVRNCWRGNYASADEVVKDLSLIEI